MVVIEHQEQRGVFLPLNGVSQCNDDPQQSINPLQHDDEKPVKKRGRPLVRKKDKDRSTAKKTADPTSDFKFRLELLCGNRI